MLNQVQLVGRPTKDFEPKTINENVVVNFTLAVNRSYKNKDGEREADFIPCQAWGKRAEFLSNYCKKGQLLSVVGQIQTRTYEREDKSTAYVTEVNVQQVESLEKRESEPSLSNEEEVKAAWTTEYNKKSVGLDATAKANLKKELAAKYQPLIDAVKTDLPF